MAVDLLDKIDKIIMHIQENIVDELPEPLQKIAKHLIEVPQSIANKLTKLAKELATVASSIAKRIVKVATKILSLFG